MKKRISVLLLILSLVLSAAASAAVYGDQTEFTSSGELSELTATEIVFKNSSNEIVSTLTANETVTASVKVKNEGSENKTVSFYLNLYNKNRIVLTDIDTQTIAAGSTAELTAAAAIPETTENHSLSAILWTDIKTMTPAASAALIPAADSGLREISLNGNKLDGFSTETDEYEFIIDKPDFYPEVKASALDGGTMVNIINPEYYPGKTVIELFYAGGGKTEYTLKYSDSNSYAGNPASEATPNNLPVFSQGLGIGKYCFSDRTNMTYSYVSGELAGKDYFICPMSWASTSRLKKIWDGTDKGSLAMFSFELTRNARVKVICESECAVEGSFAESDGWTKAVSETPYYKRLYNNTEYSANVMYTKDFTVSEKLSVDIPNHGGSAAYTVVVDYLY